MVQRRMFNKRPRPTDTTIHIYQQPKNQKGEINKMCRVFHKWDYMAPEYRRCAKCGKLQEYRGFGFWTSWHRTIDEWKNAVQWANQYHYKQKEQA